MEPLRGNRNFQLKLIRNCPILLPPLIKLGSSYHPSDSWGTIDTRYAKHRLPQLKKQQLTTLKGWRGERVNAQAVVWTGMR